MSYNTGAVGADRGKPGEGSVDYYGHADYERDQRAGISDAELLAKINADPSRMGNGGVGGDLYRQIQAGANSGGGGGGGGGGYSGGSIGAGPGGYAPGDVNFNPGGIDMGGSEPSWSNDDFIRGLAKERAESFTDSGSTSKEIWRPTLETTIQLTAP
jgi:hypothetical protein